MAESQPAPAPKPEATDGKSAKGASKPSYATEAELREETRAGALGGADLEHCDRMRE